MAKYKPFRGLRPPKDLAPRVACLPYDVMNTEEAAQMAEGNEFSLLHVTRAEIDCPPGTDIHSDIVYAKAVENFQKMIEKGWLVQDQQEMFYVYAQTMEGRTQYGIVGCAHWEDYFTDVIKKHELTRPDKEEDRMKIIQVTNANVEPVFFAYRAVEELDQIVKHVVTTQKPEYDFVADDGFGHHFWVIRDAELNQRIQYLFETKVSNLYVADGHHRTAAACRIGKERAQRNPHHTGKEEYNYFMAVSFPDNQLQILDYNRVVSDLNGLSEDEFLAKLSEVMDIQLMGTEAYKPQKLHEFSMYLSGKWYKLSAKPGTYDDNDPLRTLDVSVLSDYVLDKILGISDLRTSKRIDFVGGIRGLKELQRRVDSGEMAVAFALYPVSMKQLIDIADTGNIMPPKTTWFEPKLRSGLVIHMLE